MLTATKYSVALRVYFQFCSKFVNAISSHLNVDLSALLCISILIFYLPQNIIYMVQANRLQ